MPYLFFYVKLFGSNVKMSYISSIKLIKTTEMEYPNKVYVIDYTHSYGTTQRKFIITLVASSIETAREHIIDKIGIEDPEPIWLMNAVYPTIYVSDGSVPATLQAKILYNASFII